MLKLNKLEKSFDGVKAVQRCSFEVKDNSITALIGPNGAGKTTVFNLITGLVKPEDGEISYNTKSIIGLKSFKIAQIGIARTFQLTKLFPKLSVLDNLLLARLHPCERFWTALFRKADESKNEQRCLELLNLVGLEGKKNDLAEELSYGQQKLLEIARALATEANLLLLDEPVAGVNPVMREKIQEVLLRLKKEGKTILLIEHDMEFVMNICDEIIVMDHGVEIAVGAPKQIQNNKRVLEAYLGKD